ncbi:MAG TPA: hypothetical protein VLV54_09395, partial [Thermoanaerobaculia bacterium]|nr:hypothetical protein [Thermoanaerobaculia bacterium]
VMLRILDDGQGFDPAAEASGMGLRNLKERAASLRGKLEVATSPGSGAELTVRIPLVSPPVSVPVDPRRMVISEFLYTILPAAFFIAPIFSGSGDPRVEASGGSAWGCVPVLALIMIIPIGWTVERSSPRGMKSFANRKLEILIGLFLGWYWLDFALNAKILKPEDPWVIPLGVLLYAAFTLIWVHRVSEVRRFWRKGDRLWLWLVLPVDLGILLALGKTFNKPRPLAVNAVEAFFLLAMGIVFPYLVSRQRRTQGATQ